MSAYWRLARAELRRMRTLRSTKLLTGVFLVGVLLAVTSVLGQGPRLVPETAEEVLRMQLLPLAEFTGTPPLAVLAVISAVLAWAHEYRYGTWATTFLTAPSRAALVAVRTAVTVLWWVAAGALGTVAVAVTAGAVAAQDPQGAMLTALSVGAQALVPVAFWTVIGGALGLLLRSVAVALAAAALLPIAGEAVVLLVARRFVEDETSLADIVGFLPFASVRGVVDWSGDGLVTQLSIVALTAGAAWALLLWRTVRMDAGVADR